MFDKAAMLACFGYFLGCLWLHLIGVREAKGAEDDWAIGFIGGIFARGTFVWGVSPGAIFAESASA